MVLGTTGCSTWNPYRPDIHQGNVVTTESIGRLKAGMSPTQVQAILGTPVTHDFFQSKRWDYLNYTSRTGDKLSVRRLTLWFEGDRLNRWDVEGWSEVPSTAGVATSPTEAPFLSPAAPSKEP